MPFNAKTFREKIGTIAKPSLFDLHFVNPPSAIFVEQDKALFQDIPFRGYSAQLPGINMDTLERRYHGPQRMLPVGYFYQPFNISIIETADYNMRKLFDHWVHKIAPDSNGYFLNYYDEIIASELLVKVYKRAPAFQTITNTATSFAVPFTSSSDTATLITDVKPVRTYKLEEVYPLTVSPIVLDWGYRDTFSAVNIELAYRKWSII